MVRRRTGKAPRRSHLLLLVSLVIGIAAAGCGIPGFDSGDDPEQFGVEQSESFNPSPDSTEEDALDDQQAVPEEAFDVDIDSTSADRQSAPDRLVEAGIQEPRTLNPVLVSDPLSDEISQLVFSGLVKIDAESGEPVPDLAESWEISDDGMIYIFELRDATWHDGQPFTAHDVAFTYNLMMNEETRSPRYSRLVERIVAVEALDSSTVEFRMVAPYAPFLRTLATFGIVPQHLLGDVLPSELVTDPFGISSAVGTGPFRLNRWDRGERILFDTNREYIGSQPEIDQYEYRVVANEADILEGLQHGSIDWARLSHEQMGNAGDMPDIEAVSVPSFEMVSVILQLDPGKSELFEEPAVREAMILALDRDEASEAIWNGHARVAHGTIPPASPIHQDSAVRYEFDPSRAADLLTEAGWVTSDDGIRMKDGKPLQFSIVANGDNPTRRELAAWLVESWRELGIDVRVQYETWGTVRDTITTSRNFDALVLGYRWDIDPDQHAMWASDSIPDAFNLGSYVNLQVDRVLEDALVTMDEDERLEMYATAQDLVMEDLPVLPIVFPDLTIALGPRLHDIEPTAILVRNRATIAELAPLITEQGEHDDG